MRRLPVAGVTAVSELQLFSVDSSRFLLARKCCPFLAQALQTPTRMSAFHETLNQVASNYQTTEVNASFARSEFNRLCAGHFAANVLPELKRFEECLRHQGVRISLLCGAAPVTRATLAVEGSASSFSMLIVTYDFATRSLTFDTCLGANERETEEYFTLGQLGEVNAARVYGIIETFVCAVFNTDSLCDYEGSADDAFDTRSLG